MNHIRKQFFKYVLQSAAGMIGISIYILADTFFIAEYSGADGLTLLNLVLPIYGIIYAIGAMIGIGSATSYNLRKAQGQADTDFYFIHSLLWCAIASIPFMLLGIFLPERILQIMGADPNITRLGIHYLRIVLIGTPCFMINYTFTAFSRNDNAPTTAMIGSLSGSLFNILFDYIFMFPIGMGLAGAALATALSPVVTMLVCCTHFCGKHNHVGFHWRVPSFRRIVSCCQLGVPAFVGEITSAVTTVIFNTLILGLAGNTGVAAYGVIANISLVAMSVLNGVSQGTQPLISETYGSGKIKEAKVLRNTGIAISLAVQITILAVTWKFTEPLIQIFNSEGNPTLFHYAYNGMRLYFLGYLFAGVNILLAGYFSAIGKTTQAFVISMLRGVLAISICAYSMSKLWGMYGIWLSFFASECITFLAIFVMNRYHKK